MTTATDQIFRITYEAFSKFSNNLNRCRTFEEISECFTVNLKYLFNYHVFRASYHRSNIYVHMNSAALHTSLAVQESPDYLEHENFLLNSQIPMRWNDLNDFRLPAAFDVVPEEEGVLWGWNFMNDDRHIIVSVLSGNSKKFTQKDITFLKLVSDNLETKLLELCLFQELHEKNIIISHINEDQKEIIKQRTHEIENKNKTLLEISVLNSHNVREPLARILGLVSLMTDDDTDGSVREILPMLKASTNDLDVALQDIIQRATHDLLELKA